MTQFKNHRYVPYTGTSVGEGAVSDSLLIVKPLDTKGVEGFLIFGQNEI